MRRCFTVDKYLFCDIYNYKNTMQIREETIDKIKRECVDIDFDEEDLPEGVAVVDIIEEKHGRFEYWTRYVAQIANGTLYRCKIDSWEEKSR